MQNKYKAGCCVEIHGRRYEILRVVKEDGWFHLNWAVGDTYNRHVPSGHYILKVEKTGKFLISEFKETDSYGLLIINKDEKSKNVNSEYPSICEYCKSPAYCGLIEFNCSNSSCITNS